MDAPWDTPDALTSVHQLQGLVGRGYCVDHDSTGDLQSLVQSALGGIRKEVYQHMDFLETEHVEHKTDHAHQRKMVRFWKCSNVPKYLCIPPRHIHLEIPNKKLTRPITNGPRCKTCLVGGSKRYGIPMMVGFWWQRKKNTPCSFPTS